LEISDSHNFNNGNLAYSDAHDDQTIEMCIVVLMSSRGANALDCTDIRMIMQQLPSNTM
jgi:hypothetical protein